MKILVTGGAGYIGSVVSADLVAAGHEVAILDNFAKGHRGAVPHAAQIVTADLGDRDTLRELFRANSFEGVLHFAAFIEAGESMSLPEKYFRNNACNTLSLLEAVLEFRVPRFVFSSTAALYGSPVRTPIEEGDALAPTNAYGESKLLVEKMLEWFHRVHGLRYASLRYFNAAGAAGELGEDHHPETHLIPIVLDAAQGRRASVSIFGTDYSTPDGTCIRDYVHVSDLSSAHHLALERLGRDAAPERLIYNLGSGQGFSVRQVIDAARRVTNRSIEAVEAPRRPGDPPSLVASSEKIKRELHWRPRYTDLDAIIESAWQWRLKHPQGYSA
ncbi:MAG TPA: UDP-glucose 4-epimerase GalE [Candidatus Acidoferrum sp.]|nr:UDP-glucose 4-epimerase GalE [Candidatus Acidoferrum sp.]